MRLHARRFQVFLIPIIISVIYSITAHNAYAEEITVSGNIDYHPTDWVHNVSVPKFDPSIGELVAVRASIAGSLLGGAKYENLELSPITLQIRMESTITLYNIHGEALAVANPTDTVTRTAEGFDQFMDFAGPSGGEISDLVSTDLSDETLVTDPEELQAFIGTDTITLSVSGNGRSYIERSGNLTGIFSLAVNANAQLKYVYVPPSIDIETHTNGEDADDPTGPEIADGADVTWTYIVKNTGMTTLIDVVVTDDQGVDIICPKDTLAPDETMICNASGIAKVGQYKNIGDVSGQPVDAGGLFLGERVTDVDPSHYIANPMPGKVGDYVWLDSDQDGIQDADESPLANVTLRLLDDQGQDVATTTTNAAGLYLFDGLLPGEYTVQVVTNTLPSNVIPTFDADGFGTLHESTIVVQSGGVHLDQDFGYATALIDIETHTNGEDADDPTGPGIAIGEAVQWEYIVHNIGTVLLTDIRVTDDQGVEVTCPKTLLSPNETMSCQANGIPKDGQYANIGSVVGQPTALTGERLGTAVVDDDPSHYIGYVQPSIDLEKHTNGQDADAPSGPEIKAGMPITWEYIVTNTSLAGRLIELEVIDDQGVAVTCPETELASGESMICFGYGIATLGQYSNTGTVTGIARDITGLLEDVTVSDIDLSHYVGVSLEPSCPDDILPQLEFLGGTASKSDAPQGVHSTRRV